VCYENWKFWKERTLYRGGTRPDYVCNYRLAAEFFYRWCVGIEDCRTNFRNATWDGACSKDVGGLSMVLAVLVTGFVFVVGISITGWLAGTLVDTVKAGKTAPVGLTVKEKK